MKKNNSTVIIVSNDEVIYFKVPRNGQQIAEMFRGIAVYGWSDSPTDSPSVLIPAARKESGSPCSLCLTDEQQAIFDRAIAAGLMERTTAGRYHWLASKALLSYFCGRVFCGDYANGGIWQCDKGRFPKKEVERLFGEDWIGSYRRKRVLLHVPRNYAVVERLVERI